jgi:AAA-like domain
MEKIFNITGNCRATKHYMADVSKKLARTMRMVENGDYFIINRPRQYGKTTMLFTIADLLRKKKDFIVINTSFEGIGDDIFKEESVFTPGFIRLLISQSSIYTPELVPFLKQREKEVDSLDSLSLALSELMAKTDKKVVLLIDEVDKSSNNQLFISFLAMLRNKFLVQDEIKTFHSIVLAGVHDIKSLKLKIRSDDEQKLNSPWNIAAEFTVDMNLQPSEIKPMLEAYSADRGVKMDTQQIADRLFYHTSGYPFLVSKLCKMFDETYLPEKDFMEWTIEDVDIAARQLVKESNTNFDSLIKNLENNEELYRLVYNIAIDGANMDFNIHDTITNLGALYGIFADRNGLKIHNRIYNELIINYMSTKYHRIQMGKGADFGAGYKNDDNSLNMESVLLGFQAFMKKEYSKKDRDFLEKNGRLVFLAFIKPIINGSGYDFKEPQISEEKRLDVVITYLKEKYVAELKIWRGPKLHEKGLLQLSEYLDRQNLNEGFLIIFDHSEVKNWQSEWMDAGGKKVFAVWV